VSEVATTGSAEPTAPTEFYDRLAPFFHLLYVDWEGSIRRQGKQLAAVLAEHGIARGAHVIDAACGIGTQTIGLLGEGYEVSASDISLGAVGRARKELFGRGYDNPDVRVADLRTLSSSHHVKAAAVIACDNSVPHLLNDVEILRAFRECLACTAPGGLLIISVRDYAAIGRKDLDVQMYGVHEEAGRRHMAFQVWQWRGDLYDFSLYLTEDAGADTCKTQVLRATYYAVSTDRLLELMYEAGYATAERRDGAFFQPMLIGRKA
jgi:SAM-dependent methyltransferase